MEQFDLIKEIQDQLVKDLIKQKENQIKNKLIELGISIDDQYLKNNCQLIIGPNRHYTLLHKDIPILEWNENIRVIQEGAKITVLMNEKIK